MTVFEVKEFLRVTPRFSVSDDGVYDCQQSAHDCCQGAFREEFPIGETREKEKKRKGERGETIGNQKGSVPPLANRRQLIAGPLFADRRVSLRSAFSAVI